MGDQARELHDAREREAATREILRVIRRSPSDSQPVFEAILERASRLCDAPLGALFICDGGYLRLVAHRGMGPELVELLRTDPMPIDSARYMTARVVNEGRPEQILDVSDSELYRSGQRHRVVSVEGEGVRSQLAVPMIGRDGPVGSIVIYRREVRTFEDRHVDLVSSFADQAVIAIENVRLFQTVEARTEELSESLERQTATSDILRVISRSPTDYQPVFEAILDNAARLCSASHGLLYLKNGDHLEAVATLGGESPFVDYIEANPLPIRSGYAIGPAILDGTVVHVPDMRERIRGDIYKPSLGSVLEREGVRTLIGVPLMKGGEAIGVVTMYRREVMLFDDKHIELLTTFADQAVIAIENVRLFQALEARTHELTATIERQTATGEILRVISRSPTDFQPVFEAILDNATRLCDAPLALLLLPDDDGYRLAAHKGARAEFVDFMMDNPVPLDPDATLTGLTGATLVPRVVADIRDDPGYRAGQPQRVASADVEGIRSALFVPMTKHDACAGVICLYRREVQPFEDEHLELVKTFADQAVIAIDNVHLFQALESRTHELGEMLERQTATSDILRTISRSPTDYGPVFDAILDNATRLCEAPLAFLLIREDEGYCYAAHRGSRPEFVEFVKAHPVPLDGDGTLAGQAALECSPKQLADITQDQTYFEGQRHRVVSADIEGIRTALFVPMVKNDECLGIIGIYRREVRPFDESHVALVSTFADQAVIAIDTVRLFQALDERSRELARSVGELRALGEVGQAVSSTLDLETVLTTIISQAVALTETDGGVIAEYDEQSGTLPTRAAPGFDELLAAAGPVRLGEGAIGRAAESRAPVQIPDVDAPGAYTGRLRSLLPRAGFRALLAVPLLREDRVLGALLVARKTPGDFSTGTVELLGTFAAQSALAIHNARLFREIGEQGRALADANRHKSEFLANMSHELRTPLNAVIGFSEALAEEMFGELNEKQAEYVRDIHSSGRHLLSLINDILDLSKIEAGHMELDLSRFAVRPALENAMTLVGERASRRAIELGAELDDALGEMTADERKLKQILLNLLSNAIKFTPEGGAVTLVARREDGVVSIAVRDTGVGISAEDQAVIFEEFRQVGTDYARKVEGTGLGLTLTRRFVEMHGGEIVVESEPGKGSEFRITLPLEPPPAAAAAG